MEKVKMLTKKEYKSKLAWFKGVWKHTDFQNKLSDRDYLGIGPDDSISFIREEMHSRFKSLAYGDI